MLKQKIFGVFGVLLLAANFGTATALAATPVVVPDVGLSLQVSPSPLVITVKPGEKKTVEVKIYNGGLSLEKLKIGLQAFSIDHSNSKVTLQPTSPVEVASWVSFADPNFLVKPGERFTEKILINTPATAGFNYNFALIVSRQAPLKAPIGQSAVQGSIAIFALLDINRPGAARKLSIASLHSDRHVYEYLPAKISIRLRNDGNTLLLPDGNAYIQRQTSSTKPISVLGINPGSLYLLPGVSREYNVSWTDGLPAYVTTQDAANSPSQQHLTWNWRNSHFRIGRYIAHVVVIYDDGHRNVPVEAEISFWVIPWKLLLAATIIVIMLIIGFVVSGRFAYRIFKRKRSQYRA
jgi:hypothetical protein